MLRNKADAELIATLQAHAGWKRMVEVLTREMVYLTDQLDNLGNSREEDLFIKGQRHGLKAVIGLVNQAVRYSMRQGEKTGQNPA